MRAAASAGAGLKLRGARISTAMLRTLGTAPAAVREKSTGLPPFLKGCAEREAPKTSQSEAPGMLLPTGSRPTRSCFSTQLFYDALYEGFAPAQTAPHSASRFMIASAGATGTRWTAGQPTSCRPSPPAKDGAGTGSIKQAQAPTAYPAIKPIDKQRSSSLGRCPIPLSTGLETGAWSGNKAAG